MSDEQFLARWARRKQEAKAGHAEPAPEEAAEAHGPALSNRAAAEPAPPETELSNLPPIESIDAATDITAFLRKGIPQELSRAALRRAWSADPTIRDFVGLAENAWDFNDPNAMAGFGPLDYSAEQIDALVRRVVGVEAAEGLPNPREAAEDAARSAPAEAGFEQSSNPVKAITEPRPLGEFAAAELPSNSTASQPVAASEETPLRHRTHGGALPR
ncbi:DUF3306 domain-containing protein [Bradyrhizobium sp. 61]|uniref:DUF3306 domain-containing protein n=1 Tax=Bradyrhizobium sp. 61 TaxID=2782679 RepID=UPI001FFA0FD5|nr:DUF3306 domain-containing protein [Bradyrhizobium sp. 61]MCK1274995.1 DUF3306 domain-containing protein [Bradyrhizobium sp. 61]